MHHDFKHTDHIVPAILKPGLVGDDTLHVVAVVSNPVRYHQRYRIFRDFVASMEKTSGIKLHVVEAAFGDRHHEVTSADNPDHLMLRVNQELWHKENMINLGMRRAIAKYDAKYLAWVDGDVWFGNDDWAHETVQALQHYPIVQPWSECVDMGAYGNALGMFKSFTSLEAKGIKQQVNPGDPYTYGHSGFAWACTRRFWEEVGGLMDFPILGSADHHMAWSLVNHVDWTIHGGMGEAFKRRCREWQRKAFAVTQGDVGYIPGILHHRFHGPKGRRFYRERWQILVDAKFDPDTDLGYDAQGLLYLKGKPELHKMIKGYFRARHEDSIEES